MVTKLDVLVASRSRALKALEHRITVILEFADGVSVRKVKVSAKLLENAYTEFKTANDELDGLIADKAQLTQSSPPVWPRKIST